MVASLELVKETVQAAHENQVLKHANERTFKSLPVENLDPKGYSLTRHLSNTKNACLY